MAWSPQNLILLESWSWKKISLCKHEGDDRDAGSVTPLHVVSVNVFILFFLCFNNKRAGIDLYAKFHLEAQNCLRLFIVIWFCLHLHCLHLPKGSPAYPDGFTTIPHKDFLFITVAQRAQPRIQDHHNSVLLLTRFSVRKARWKSCGSYYSTQPLLKGFLCNMSSGLLCQKNYFMYQYKMNELKTSTGGGFVTLAYLEV